MSDSTVDTPRLELELPRRASCSEPVRLELRLGWGEARRLPLEHATTDVVSFSLLDGAGEVLARADGLTKRLRALPELRVGPPRSHDALPMAEFPANGVLEWSEELLAFFDAPPPGEYAVTAEYRFEPAGADRAAERLVVRSPAVRLSIDEARVVMGDAVVGDTGDLHVLARHQRADRSPSLELRVAPRGAFEHFICGGELPDLGADPRLAVWEAQAIDPSPLGHRRWVVGVAGRSLQAALFVPGRTAEVRSYELGRVRVLVGRPVQVDDDGLTVRVIDDEGQIDVLRFDASLALQEETAIGVLAARPNPAHGVADPDGSYLLAYGADGSFPLSLLDSRPGRPTVGSVVVGAEAIGIPGEGEPSASDRLLAVRLASGRTGGPAGVLALSLHTRPGAGRWLARIHRAGGESEPQIERVALPVEGGGVDVTAADIALGPSGPVGVVQLADGRMFEWGAQGLGPVADAAEGRPSWVRVVAVAGGVVWVAIDPRRGVVSGMIQSG